MAGRYDLEIIQGSTFAKKLTLKEDDELTVIDLTNCTAKLQIRDNYKGNLIFEISTEIGGLSIPEPTLGEIWMEISAHRSKLWNFECALYDLEIYRGASVLRLIQGKVILLPEVTEDDELNGD